MGTREGGALKLILRYKRSPDGLKFELEIKFEFL
jgi:hypothetical protein